eukprot:CAMPEP_0197892556 /NCGR_PEP_ID=MMETSP1439-20131203/30821_1 /TAXON_ID=66791 /ORGANISM="Gonyaulax spinifera, Strain CCMP409" /LENGTH=113 /DNA_ID=CAMNT_0043512743 /DNA_START=54 /DNA_END=395 /DNA_ORIENTATION=+
MGALDVGSGVKIDVDDEADTFWVAFEEYIGEVFPDPAVAKSFRDKFMDSHTTMFRKLNLEQLEDIAKGIFTYLREEEIAATGGRASDEAVGPAPSAAAAPAEAAAASTEAPAR